MTSCARPLVAGRAVTTPRADLDRQERRDGQRIVSTDPADPERVVAAAPIATAAEVTAAVRTAERGYRQWAAVPAHERAVVLSRAAAWLRERRAIFAALCVREAGKPWAEADADVCQAIDFLEFYARGAVALGRGRALFQVPGERNSLHYVPRGIVAAIAPWNYLIAIPAGMVAAGLATGNAVVFKPAEQTPLCGFVLVEALRDAGVPPDALGLLQGNAETGAALIRDPRVATIAFTGSSRTGLDILAATGDVVPGRRQIKRAIVDYGWQELHHRRRGRRPRQRDRAHHPLGVRICRPEVLDGIAPGWA